MPSTATPSIVADNYYISTIAGTGSSTYSGDGGQATSAGFNPSGVAVDSSGIHYFIRTIYLLRRLNKKYSLLLTYIVFPIGNVYIADLLNNRIRKVTVSTGIITTIAGTGASSYSGDGGKATSAALYRPFVTALDSSGTQYYLLLRMKTVS